MLQCWRRTGHLLSFFVPTPEYLTAQEPPPQGISHPRQKKMLMPGDQPGGGWVLGAAGIDWCITRSPLESNKAWATPRSNSVRDSKFATNIPVTFTWESFLEWSSCYISWRIHKIFLNESSLKVTYRAKAGTGCSNHYIQWISTREANYIINSIVINPVDSVIHLLNNWTCSSGSGPSDKGGAGYPDPEITGRGGRSPKFFFSASVGLV